MGRTNNNTNILNRHKEPKNLSETALGKHEGKLSRREHKINTQNTNID